MRKVAPQDKCRVPPQHIVLKDLPSRVNLASGLYRTHLKEEAPEPASPVKQKVVGNRDSVARAQLVVGFVKPCCLFLTETGSWLVTVSAKVVTLALRVDRRNHKDDGNSKEHNLERRVRAVARSKRVHSLKSQNVYKCPAEYASTPSGQKLPKREVGSIHGTSEVDVLVGRRLGVPVVEREAHVAKHSGRQPVADRANYASSQVLPVRDRKSVV